MAPENRGTSRDPYWDIKRSMANAIAHSPQPSLLRLHNEVLEEFGYRPDLELVDYFCSIAEIAEEEIADYFRRIALPTGEQAGPGGKVPAGRESGREMAERIAAEEEPTILRFRTEYEDRFGSAPPEDLLRYFLQKMQEKARGRAKEKMPLRDTEFAAAIAARAGATVLRFRQEYQQQYGREPSEELTRFFLLKKQQLARKAAPAPGQDRSGPDSGNAEQEDAKVIFAKTAASGLVTTILQFRKTYEKVYKEPPSPELIEVFLKNLPRG